MARMHAKRKGKSGSKKPINKAKPDWVEAGKEDVETQVVKLSKEGHGPSAIGRILRDSYGIPSVRSVANRKVGQLLKDNRITQEFPEDILCLIKKALMLRKHLDKNPKDLHNKRGLNNIEAKIKRLQDYYKRKNVLPKTWYYKPEEAALLVK